MLELNESQVVKHAGQVLGVLADEATHIEVSIYSVTQCEVISLSQNSDSVGESALTSHTFLKGSRGSSSDVHFSIE